VLQGRGTVFFKTDIIRPKKTETTAEPRACYDRSNSMNSNNVVCPVGHGQPRKPVEPERPWCAIRVARTRYHKRYFCVEPQCDWGVGRVMKRIVVSGMMLALLLASILILAFDVRRVKAATSSVWIIDPGPDSYPTRWNASNPDAGCVGTPYFNFTEGQCGTFFVNVTISDVNCMTAWSIGIIYDNTTLEFLRAWRPSDHVFRPVEDMGYIPPPLLPIVEDVDATHRMVLWGYSLTMGPSWCFNGTGTLCQIQFNMIKPPNKLYPLVTAVWSFDPAATTVGFSPSGSETPTLNSAYLKLTWLTQAWPEFYAEPSEYKAYVEGEDVTVEIWVRNVDPGWETIDFQFSLSYNASMLELTSLENGTWLDTFTSNGESVVYTVLERSGPYDTGWLRGYAFITPGVENEYWPPYPSGEGMLFRFHFRAVSETIFPTEDWTWLEINETVTTDIFGMNVTTGPPGSCHYRAPIKGLGDLDYDGTVDMGDVMIALDAFGSSPTNPRWNPPADLDGNGRVDMSDIMIILMNFGQHYP
jgi:hypothetical protein